jgi:hypothetical protein
MSDELKPIDLPEEGEEEVDGLPVLADVRPIEPVAPVAPPALPTVQAAAVAATGFVAGAATVALAMRRSAKKVGRLQAATPRGADEGPLPGVRTFLVHVHFLNRPGE